MADTHLKSLEISNYRGFKNLKISKLGEVNILGGANGIGKSALLEALFHLSDRTSPVTLFRPFQWRQIPLAPTDNLEAIKQVFYRKNLDDPIVIAGVTNKGVRLRVEYKFGRQEISNAVSQNVQQGELTRAATETSYTSSGEGYRVVAKANSTVEFDAIAQVGTAGVIVNVVKHIQYHVPQSVIVTSTIRGSDDGIPVRYSNLVRRNEEDSLLSFLRLVHPEVEGLKLLAAGGTTILHADIGNNTWVQLPFLGEGAVSLASTVLAMADSQGGSVFLDEIDAAVHHGTLEEMWRLVLKASKQFDVQVFATTHSEESLEALAQAMTLENAQSRVSYHRLRRGKAEDVVAVSYDGDSLNAALTQDWEVR